jgi:hypothetical protein
MTKARDIETLVPLINGGRFTIRAEWRMAWQTARVFDGHLEPDFEPPINILAQACFHTRRKPESRPLAELLAAANRKYWLNR